MVYKSLLANNTDNYHWWMNYFFVRNFFIKTVGFQKGQYAKKKEVQSATLNYNTFVENDAIWLLNVNLNKFWVQNLKFENFYISF